MVEDDTRSYADERRRLLQELELERKQLIRNIETCRIRDIDRPFIDHWSLKDIVGHVSSWEAEVVISLRDLHDGIRPAILDFDQSTLNKWNEDHVERKRDLNFASVLDQLRGGRARLMEQIERISDDALGSEASPEYRLVHAALDHDREHWHAIAARLAGMDGVRPTGPASVPAEAASPA